MKRLALICVLFLIGNPVCAQSFFKGLEYGMTKKEAKAEYKAHKKEYIRGFDIGNSFSYQAYSGNFRYKKDGSLYAVMFEMADAATYENASYYLNATRTYYENLDYDVFSKPSYWPDKWKNNSFPRFDIDLAYGLLMSDPGKKLMIQIYLDISRTQLGTLYQTQVIIYNYDDFIQMWESGD